MRPRSGPGSLAIALSVVLTIGGGTAVASETMPVPARAVAPLAAAGPTDASVVAPAETAEAAVRELLAESGADYSLEQLLAAVRAGGLEGARLGASGASDAEARVALIGGALEQAFALERLQPIVVRNVAAAVEKGDVDAMLAHNRSELGRRLQAAGRTRQPSTDPVAYERFVAGFGARVDDAERLAVLTDYVRDGGVADLIARFSVDIQVTSLHAALLFLGEDARAHVERSMAEALDAFEPIRDRLSARLPLVFAYTYDGFTLAELRAMTAVELSGAGRRVTAGVFDGFREVAVAGNADFVARVRAAMSLAELQVEI